MNLFGGYLLVLIILFAANFSLLLGNFRINNLKLLDISLVLSVSSLILFNVAIFLKSNISCIIDYLNFAFIISAIILFIILLLYIKKLNLKISFLAVGILYFVLVLILSSQADLYIFNSLFYSLFIFITMFFTYQVTKLLIYAKRDYPIIVGEFMVLFSILLFIFGMTFSSTVNLDYSMFSPFLILTPTYQLIYIIIFIAVILVIGLIYNDNKGGF